MNKYLNDEAVVFNPAQRIYERATPIGEKEYKRGDLSWWFVLLPTLGVSSHGFSDRWHLPLLPNMEWVFSAASALRE